MNSVVTVESVNNVTDCVDDINFAFQLKSSIA